MSESDEDCTMQEAEEDTTKRKKLNLKLSVKPDRAVSSSSNSAKTKGKRNKTSKNKDQYFKISSFKL